MCGIFLIFSKTGIFKNVEQIVKNFQKISHRGPDSHSIQSNGNCMFGFHRLAINDTSDNGMQPFKLNENFLMCNGEIYNYDFLIQDTFRESLKSHSDCEIIPHIFEKYGVEDGVKMMDGVFAICYIDRTSNSIVLCRDKIGVKPLFYAEDNEYFGVCSEAKGLDLLFDSSNIQQLQPSTILTYSMTKFDYKFENYWNMNEEPQYIHTYDQSISIIHKLLIEAVKKRMTSDREIGCLLSGGLDSSIVASILSKELQKSGKKLHTFSVGFPDSTDIIYAREVSKYINSVHHELIIQYEDALSRLDDIVYMTETYDTTTIRASTPMFLLCEWISKNFPEKVIFSGEGSDELFCGYLYFHNAPSSNDAHKDSIRLMNELYKYDVLRADRCTAGNGLEFREPFLDQDLIQFVSIMNPEFKRPKEYEKTILREAFSSYLPFNVVWRRKAAFSDAVSSSVKPWYKWIQDYVKDKEIFDFGGTQENNYYRTIFYKKFSNYRPNIKLWLPKWSNVGAEPSATVLNIYKKDEH